jgi:hypothetical protein
MTTFTAIIETIRRQFRALIGRRDHNTDRVL